MALEKKAIELSLEIISEALEETVCILQDLISEGKFEEAKGLLDECSNIQQEQEDLEILLVNKQSDYAALEGMIEEAKHLVSKYEIDDTECEEEENILIRGLLCRYWVHCNEIMVAGGLPTPPLTF